MLCAATLNCYLLFSKWCRPFSQHGMERNGKNYSKKLTFDGRTMEWNPELFLGLLYAHDVYLVMNIITQISRHFSIPFDLRCLDN